MARPGHAGRGGRPLLSKDNKAIVRRFAEECWGTGPSTSPASSLSNESSATGGLGRRGLVDVIAAISSTGTAIVRVEGGRIEEVWDNVDLFEIYRELGMISPPGSMAPDS